MLWLLAFSDSRCSIYWQRGARTLHSRAPPEAGGFARRRDIAKGGGVAGLSQWRVPSQIGKKRDAGKWCRWRI